MAPWPARRTAGGLPVTGLGRGAAAGQGASAIMSAEFELCPGRRVGGEQPCFIIAEIGQNHQGDLAIAKRMIRMAKVRARCCSACGRRCGRGSGSVVGPAGCRGGQGRPVSPSPSFSASEQARLLE